MLIIGKQEPSEYFLSHRELILTTLNPSWILLNISDLFYTCKNLLELFYRIWINFNPSLESSNDLRTLENPCRTNWQKFVILYLQALNYSMKKKSQPNIISSLKNHHYSAIFFSGISTSRPVAALTIWQSIFFHCQLTPER